MGIEPVLKEIFKRFTIEQRVRVLMWTQGRSPDLQDLSFKNMLLEVAGDEM